MYVAVNENDIRKTMRDAIPRLLSWIMRFKNMEVLQKFLSFFLKLYLLLSFVIEVFPLLFSNATDTSRPYCFFVAFLEYVFSD